jgi:hypothetical protein
MESFLPIGWLTFVTHEKSGKLLQHCTDVFGTLSGKLKPATEHKMLSSHIFEDRGL